MIPRFAPLKNQFKLDYDGIMHDLKCCGMVRKSVLATTTFYDGQSKWKTFDAFNDEKFEETSKVKHYNEDGELQDGMNTFHMMNLTMVDIHDESKTNSWDEDRTIPLWVKHQDPWEWRDDLWVPNIEAAVGYLPFEYLTTVRCISLPPGAVGVIHADSGRVMNQNYYESGMGSLTINVDDGGANLWFEDEYGDEQMVDESKFTAWHFDDSAPHCVTKTERRRIQLRIFGKLKYSYRDILDFDQAIW